jgi:hypothetical protein
MTGFLGWLRAFAFTKPAPMPAGELLDFDDSEVTECGQCRKRVKRCDCEAK